MFAAGEMVVYGGEGVCRVERVGPSGMAYDDGGRLYYHLTPLYRSGTVLTPVDTGILMRPVITREAALALIASIPMLPPCKPEQAGVRAARDFYHQVVMRWRAGGYDPQCVPQAGVGGAPWQKGQSDGRALSQARRGSAVWRAGRCAGYGAGRGGGYHPPELARMAGEAAGACTGRGVKKEKNA